jgi:single-strand DNA-binding protein
MSSLNQITLLGNVGHDPETRDVGGTAVASFSLATSRQWKGKDGGKQEKTEWHRCVVWNLGTQKLADIAAQYVKKGDKVLVVGSMEYRKYTDQSGVEKQAAEVRVSDLRLLGGRKDQAAPAPAKPPAQTHDDFPNALDDEDDGLPF